MTVLEALHEGARALGGVDTPVLDATVLLSHALGVSKERLLADLPEPLDGQAELVYRDYLDQRLRGIPVSYIRHLKEFWGLEFYVDGRVLVPRPDTETLVEHAIDIVRAHHGVPRLHDVCTGTGCIAISVAKTVAVDASVSDISAEALEVCATNSIRHLGRALPATVSDLLGAVGGTYHIITANPPYLRDDVVADMRAAGWPEPVLALAGGPDGSGPARRLVSQALRRLEPGGRLVMEVSPEQAHSIRAAMEERGYRDSIILRDLAGRDRVVSGETPP